jgi:hypothetical protein
MNYWKWQNKPDNKIWMTRIYMDDQKTHKPIRAVKSAFYSMVTAERLISKTGYLNRYLPALHNCH